MKNLQRFMGWRLYASLLMATVTVFILACSAAATPTLLPTATPISRPVATPATPATGAPTQP